MSCTCSAKKYPCPVHRGGHLPVPEIVERAVFVIRISQRWGTNEKWFSTVTKDAVTVFIGSDRENHWDAMLEATCFLNSQNQKPKEK